MKEERSEANILEYDDYLKDSTDNKNIQKGSNSQNQTTENANEDGSSDHNNLTQKEKSFETQKLEVKDMLTKKLEEYNYTSKSLSEIYQFLNKYCSPNLQELIDDQRPKKETKFMGKKRASKNDDFLGEEDTSQTPDEHNKYLDEVLIDIITQILHNLKVFFNEISLSVYKYKLNLSFEKNLNMIIKTIFNKDILKKNLKELILLEEEKDLEKEESIKNKIGIILKKEKESNNLYIFNMLKMKIKHLILIYINDRVNKFNNCKLKTLKDNINYTEKEKDQIKKMILNYMNSLKESNSKNSGIKLNELDIPLPPSNLTSLSNNEDLGDYNLKKFISIEKNENKNENIIKSQDNQKKDEEQEYSNKKIENKTDDEKGKRLENLVRSTVKKNYLFVVKEIEKILVKMNKKIKRVSIYNDITKNSTEHFKVIFTEQISSILKRKMENQQVIDDILNDNGNSDELTTLKELLTMTILDIINKFIKDETLILKNGTKIKINILGLETTETQKKISERIKDNMKIIKDKLKDIVECEKGRIREKSQNNQN
jgi:hypothetical protein